MFTGKPFKGYAETSIKPCGYGQLRYNKPIFIYFYVEKIKIKMKDKAGIGKEKTTGCNDCDTCKIPGGNPGELQIVLLQGVTGKIKNRNASVTNFHTYGEISKSSFGIFFVE